MKKNNTQRSSGRRITEQQTSLEVEDFAHIADQNDPLVEHMTIPGFLRRIPHRWNIDEITRFGDKMGRVAEAMQLAYLTAVDRSLGVIRVFPVPLLQRVYTVMAPQFGWPRLLEIETLEDGRKTTQRDELRRQERASKVLEELSQRADNVELLQSLQSVRDHLHGDMQRLRQEIVSAGETLAPQ